MRVETRYIRPATVARSHDWQAFFPDCEDEGPVGWGETEADAVKDLADQVSDLWLCCENEVIEMDRKGMGEALSEAEAAYELRERERMDQMDMRAEMAHKE